MRKNNRVSIWAGNFESINDLNDYLSDKYDANEMVSSEFKNSFGIRHFDSDFSESNFSEECDFEKLFRPLSYSKDIKFDPSTIQKGKYNSVILIYDFDYPNKVISESRVTFLGAFEYTKS
jgi:hypothetical protein